MADGHQGDHYRCADTIDLETHIAGSNLTSLRLSLAGNGYHPVPVTGPYMNVKSPGKQPLMANWREVCAKADDAEIARWARDQRNCTNTGLLCGELVGIDIDVLVSGLADEIRSMATAMLGATPMVRIGKAPKLLLCYRAAEPFSKMETPDLVLPDGSKAQVEILAAGQQFVSHGIYPDTKQPYRWLDGAPEVIKLIDLQTIAADDVRAFLKDAESVIRAAGGRKQAEIDGRAAKTAAIGAKPINFGGGDFFKAVNRAALDQIEKWFPVIFPTARQEPGTGAWRVSSAELGRQLQEDLSVHPVDGGRDFGTEKSVSPIDIVIEHGGAADAKQAAFWLCEQIQRDPVSLGWKEPKKERKEQKQKAADSTDAKQGQAQAGDWYDRAITGSKGQVLGILANAMLALREDPAWRGVLAYDEMQATALLCKPVPRFAMPPEKGSYPRPVRDDDVILMQEWFQIAGLPTLAKDTLHDAVERCARECGFHPVRNYLTGLRWDGVERLETWLKNYLGAEDTPYTRAIGRMFMVSAVARILQPGCKCDYMLVLEGYQGARKSTVCRILGGDWFSDNMPENVASEDASQHLRGKWLLEVAEMHALTKSETTALKAFITRQTEDYRPSYGRREVHEPRQCVFVGTTNKAQYLKDETGARRFWPVKVAVTRPINTDLLSEMRDQLFAEAVHRFGKGEHWWPDDAFERQHIQPEQEARFEADAWEDAISDYLADKKNVTVLEVARTAIGMEVAKLGTADQRRVTAILERLGWERGKKDWKGNRWWVRCS